VRKNAQVVKFERPSLSHRKSYRRQIYNFARHASVLPDFLFSLLYLILSLRNYALNFEKTSKVAKLATFWDLYLVFGKEIVKIRRKNVSNFTIKQ